MGGIILKNELMCSGCGLCASACEQLHGESRIKYGKNVKKPLFCRQCPDAPCMTSCRVGAVKIINNIPIIDSERCVGCKLCLEACPAGCITFTDLTAHKCVLCMDADVLLPACIEACPDRLLSVRIR